jgi:glutaminase
LDQVLESGRGPIVRYLRELHGVLAGVTGGKVADYIPELAKANPNDLGIAIATADGAIYSVGDCGKPFTIQSISKAFVYGDMLAEYGRDFVLTKVGVEPSGEAFNAIIFDQRTNRPFNPMVNAGAIATTALVKGANAAERTERMRRLFERLAGRPLTINQAVFASEKETGHRNRAIAWMMLNSGMITGDPNEALDVYFAQCSIEVTCRDLAVMAATLANGGTQPVTGEEILPAASARDVVSVMSTCGMYNYAGQWSFEIGLPAKSGVGGGIIAVVPGQLGIAVYSPPLDALGNSLRGIAAFKAMSRDFALHVFGTHVHGGAVVRREVGGDVVRSKRLRSPQETRILDENGRRVWLIELQGALYFGTAERLIRRVEALAGTVDWVILDFRRVHAFDQAASELLLRAHERSGEVPEMLFAAVPTQGRLATLAGDLARDHAEAVFDDADAALQWCEDRLIGRAATGVEAQLALSGLALFSGLSLAEIRRLERVVKALAFAAGDVIIHEGDAGRLLFVLARGSVGVRLKGAEGHGSRAGKRIATFGPGVSFGEMALFDGGRRSADIVAEEAVLCYGFAVEDLREIGQDHPGLLTAILSNIAREMSQRLRRANDEIRALDA